MNKRFYADPCWSTACFGGTVDTTPMDLSDLTDHLNLCRDVSGRWFAFRSAVENVYLFLVGRQLTTVLMLVLVGLLPSVLM